MTAGHQVGTARIHPLILSGGSGTRLWPLSRLMRPKQFMPLAGELPMLVDTALRLQGVSDLAEATVICNEEHRFAVGEILASHGLSSRHIILEPAGRNTAAAVAVGAMAALEDDPDALVLVMPSDHVIGNVDAFRQVVEQGRAVAAGGWLVTFGIQPTVPHTGYGYIRAGAPMAGQDGAFVVDRFVEKPDEETARAFLASGDYSWNSGIFLFPAALYLAELEKFSPEVLATCRQAWDDGKKDMDFCRLDKTAFLASPSLSVDVAVMEKTDRAAVIPASMDWNDVGAWDALWDIGQQDEQGNVTRGDVMLHNSCNNYVRSEDGCLIAVVGIQDAVVVATDDAILVADRAQVQDVKHVVEALGRAGRNQRLMHSTVHRPWGTYRSIDHGSRFQVKQIVVKPGARLSLQYHHHRAEHWIVVEGTARVTCGTRTFLLRENESTYIPVGEQHRLENPGTIPLRLIEVQSGGYLGEDDIVRIEDTYGRLEIDAPAS